MSAPGWVIERLQGKEAVYSTIPWKIRAVAPQELQSLAAPYTRPTRLPLGSMVGATHAGSLQNMATEDTLASYHRQTRQSLSPAMEAMMPHRPRKYDEGDAILLLAHARAGTTNATYASIRRGYENFLMTNVAEVSGDIRPFPLNIWLLARYVAYLSDVRQERLAKAYKTSTILQYVRVLLTINKMHPATRNLTVQENEILRMVRAAVVRVRGKPPVKRAATMTVKQLRQVSYTVPPSRRRSSTVALLVGVSALLRIRELCELRRSDVSFTPDETAMLLRIKWSKTDPGRSGTTLHVGCACTTTAKTHGATDNWCPTHRMLQLVRDIDQSPRSTQSCGEGIFGATYEQLSTDIRMLVSTATGSSAGCTTHSMRRTGVVLLHEAGLDDVQIAEYGRWADTRMVRDIYRRDKTGIEHEQMTYTKRMMTSV